jgi:NAD(P)-dependent dehydrogenase (short-subunit alcohol dehydrogenase family)
MGLLDVQNPIVLITGVTDGIGKAVALLFGVQRILGAFLRLLSLITHAHTLSTRFR